MYCVVCQSALLIQKIFRDEEKECGLDSPRKVTSNSSFISNQQCSPTVKTWFIFKSSFSGPFCSTIASQQQETKEWPSPVRKSSKSYIIVKQQSNLGWRQEQREKHYWHLIISLQDVELQVQGIFRKILQWVSSFYYLKSWNSFFFIFSSSQNNFQVCARAKVQLPLQSRRKENWCYQVFFSWMLNKRWKCLKNTTQGNAMKIGVMGWVFQIMLGTNIEPSDSDMFILQRRENADNVWLWHVFLQPRHVPSDFLWPQYNLLVSFFLPFSQCSLNFFLWWNL